MLKLPFSPAIKNGTRYVIFPEPRNCAGSLAQPKHRKMDEIWNVERIVT
jgi:hypothetical protein